MGEREICSNDTCGLICAFCFLLTLFLSSLSFPPCRPYAGIFSLFFVLFRPCNSCLFLFRVHVILLAALVILRHVVQNSCRFLFVLFFLVLWSGLFCCVLVPGTLAFHLLCVDKLQSFLFFSVSVCDHISCLSRMKCQHGHWLCCCFWVEKTVYYEDKTQLLLLLLLLFRVLPHGITV